jgi:hypothetical protein
LLQNGRVATAEDEVPDLPICVCFRIVCHSEKRLDVNDDPAGESIAERYMIDKGSFLQPMFEDRLVMFQVLMKI